VPVLSAKGCCTTTASTTPVMSRSVTDPLPPAILLLSVRPPICGPNGFVLSGRMKISADSCRSPASAPAIDSNSIGPPPLTNTNVPSASNFTVYPMLTHPCHVPDGTEPSARPVELGEMAAPAQSAAATANLMRLMLEA
jgi:hypothetical protein